MCDPITTATVGITAGINYLEGTRRKANASARATEAANAAALEAQKKQITALPSMPTLEEPLKDATDRVDASRADAQRQQSMRRGLMSTFTRYQSGAASTSAQSSAGKATKLGG